MTKHASIVPLIGGETIGNELAFGTLPEYMLSYTPFESNDSHIVNYYKQRGLEIPYHFIDKGPAPFKFGVDSVSSVCPCAGLSQLNLNAGSHNAANDWMTITADFVMESIKPRVYWGENAPGLMSGLGDGVREKLYAVAEKHGYSTSFYRTKSLLHGLPQVRTRSFFFFWKGNEVPFLNYFDKPYIKIEDLLRGVKGNFQTEVINPKTPSKDPFYRYVLEEIAGGMTHKDYVATKFKALPVRNNDVMCIIEDHDGTFEKVGKWLDANGFPKQALRCRTMDAKLSAGGSVMRRGTTLPKDYIGAFVGHYPQMLTHPDEDRYINYREAMTIMGLPDDFELLHPKKNSNHICQNVPVQTARDIASEIKVCLETPDQREWTSSGHLFQYNNNQTHMIETPENKSASLSSFFS